MQHTLTTQSGKIFKATIEATGAIKFTFLDGCDYSGVVIEGKETVIRPCKAFCAKFAGDKPTQFVVQESNIIPKLQVEVSEIDTKIEELAQKAKQEGVKQFYKTISNPNKYYSILTINYYIDANGKVVR